MGTQLLTTIDREGYGNDNYTHTLIHSNSYHGDDNFRDDGSLSLPVTKIGTPFHSTFLPTLGNTSIRFDGTSYLTMNYNSIFDYDSSMNFTIDFWIKVDNNAATQVIMGQFVGQSGPGWTMYFVNPGSIYIYSAGAFISVPNFIGFNNTWFHFAWVQRAGIGSKIFKNGVQVASTGAYPLPTGTTTEKMSIGARDDPGAKYFLTGYLAEIRFSSIVRWWTNFDPPNRAYGRLKRYWGGNNCVCLISGEETMDSSSTFTEWSKSQHTVNLIGNGTYKDPNTKVLGDASWNNEGLSDYFQITDSITDFSFAAYEDFTFDMWLYIDSFQPDAASWGIFTTSIYNSAGIVLLYSGGGNLFVWGANSAGPRINGWIAVSTIWNQWAHIAVVRNGGDTIKMYINGLQDGVTWTYSGALPCLGGQFNILGRHVGANRSIRAKVDNFRVIKGEALWTANFSANLPSNKPDYTYPTIYNGGLNCVCLITGGDYMTSASTFNERSTSVHVVTINGIGTQKDINNRVFAPSSWDGNGTSDYMTITSGLSDFNFATGEEFTFDTWLWVDSVQPDNFHWGVWTIGLWNSSSIGIYVHNTFQLYEWAFGSTVAGGGGIIPLNQWFHLALVRRAGVHTIYINGVVYGGAWNWGSSDNAMACSTGLYIMGREGSVNQTLHGKFDHFRVTKGQALWTSNFSADLPTKTFDYM